MRACILPHNTACYWVQLSPHNDNSSEEAASHDEPAVLHVTTGSGLVGLTRCKNMSTSTTLPLTISVGAPRDVGLHVSRTPTNPMTIPVYGNALRDQLSGTVRTRKTAAIRIWLSCVAAKVNRRAIHWQDSSSCPRCMMDHATSATLLRRRQR